MPIAINGSGTITGISAGGLPDGVITTDDIAADAVTSAKIASGAIVDADVNASAAIADSKLTGTTCKAFVNFNGTSTVAIRASYNVSSITDNGTGDYTVNFTTAMPDTNYELNGSANWPALARAAIFGLNDTRTKTTTACPVLTMQSTTFGLFDSSDVSVAIFR